MKINKETITAKKNELKNKWNKANKKYPWLKTAIIASGVTLVTGGLYCGYQIHKKNDVIKKDSNTVNQPLPFFEQDADGVDHHHFMTHYAGMVTNAGDNETMMFFPAFDYNKESLSNLWNTAYKDNWNKIMECVGNMVLREGEMFCIENRLPYNPTKAPVVSHFMDLSTE